ncbi:hypothetical protein GGI15_003177 [Coemansia interrupta]|uniref:Uncharacterized protein n=1 Tax=Coemansia interrupta TaxID=1126814 RepID=A0A9W8H8R1_9FUNG|nr:hypothetical protein GGI15_003177 [Coemansia interrupta]
MRSQRSNGNTTPPYAHEQQQQRKQQQQQQQQQIGIKAKNDSARHGAGDSAEVAAEDGSDASQYGGEDAEDMTDSVTEYPTAELAYSDHRHSRFMLPRASGLSTMGDIHSFAHSPVDRASALTASSLPTHDQGSVYPATWHEYEDQFNYFYNCHFIEQDYYDYLSSGYPQADSMAGSGSNEHVNDADDASDQGMEYYSDDSGSAVDAIDEDIGDIDVHMSSVSNPPQPAPEPANEETAPNPSHADIDHLSDQNHDKDALS